MKKNAILMALAITLFVAPLAAADDLWLHVRVQEEGGALVSVNLPMSVIEAAMPMLPEGGVPAGVHPGHVNIDDWEIQTEEFRRLWNEVRNTPDMTFVTVQDTDENVRVWKEAGYLKVRVQEDGTDGETVNVRVPEGVVDALLSGEGNKLDVEAAMAALAAEGEGELVTVEGNGDQVRVWVDRVAEAK